MGLRLPTRTPDDPMSVLLLRNIPEHASRSMERFADEIARELRSQPAVRLNETTVHASRLFVHRTTRQLDRQLSLLLRYPAHARRQSADVYHVVDHTYAQLVRSVPAGRAVVTCHDLMLLHAEMEDIGFRGRRITVNRFRWSTSFLRDAAIVACVSQATADDVSNLLRVEPSRIRVIPLGVGPVFAPMTVEARSDFRRSIDPTGRRVVVLHVSTGGPYKNIRRTLQVIDALRSQGSDPILMRVGVPLGPEDLVFARELGVIDRVREFGGVPDEELARLYAAADVLLFPSRWEGFGWPPLEALACGTPSVIASECRAVVDLVGDAALSEPAADVRRLAVAVHQIATSPPLRAELVDRGRKRVATLTWGRTINAYLRAYDEVVGRGTQALEAR